MKDRLRVFTAMGFMLTVFLLAAVPAWAQDVDDRIKALEKELTQLKEQQIELKKEATAAAAAVPDFAYRPGAGMAITAADQSWGFRIGHELALDMMWLEGQDARREGDFGIFGRRNRPQLTYTVDRGFWEFAFELDVDGDETGTKETIIQRACMRTRFDRVNPWLPTLQFGMDCSGAGSRFRSTEMSLELPTLDRNNGFNTGSHTGVGVNWSNIPAFGLPGNMQFIYYVPVHGMGRGDGLKDQSNKVDHNAVFTINPFSESKNKWLTNFGLSMFGWYGVIDDRAPNYGTDSFQIRSQEGSTRVLLFTSPSAGDDGYHLFLSPSARIGVGPYAVSGLYGRDVYYTSGNSEPGQMRAEYFKIMNDLYIWSPKGFLTGNADEAGTLGLHYSFERTWVNCGTPANTDCNTAAGGIGRRLTLIVNEVGIKYWFRPAISLHLAYKNYDASNAPVAAQQATGCRKNATIADAGKSCSWNDLVLRFYFIF
jgi:hypothetical protein